MSQPATVFVLDLPDIANGVEVTVVGWVTEKKKRRDHVAMELKDITGSVWMRLEHEAVAALEQRAPISKGVRLRVTGAIGANKRGQPILQSVRAVENLGRISSHLAELDVELREQASRMLLSRACSSAARAFKNKGFIEFDSRVISRRWDVDGLEPVHVIYPGFGGPAVLATSPASQVTDFLISTGVMRAFTASASFSTTYRWAHAPTELRVLVAKSLDMDDAGQEELLLETSNGVLRDLGCRLITGPEDRMPTDDPPPVEGFGQHSIARERCELHVRNSGWTSTVDSVTRVRDSRGAVVAEGHTERLRNGVTIRGLVIYPSVFLESIQTIPARRLRDLGRLNVWV